MHQGLLVLATLLALPLPYTAGEPPRANGSPAARSAELADVEALLVALDGQPPAAVWELIHRLEPQLQGDAAERLSAFIGAERFSSAPRNTRFAAAVLVRLCVRDAAPRDVALTALLQLARGRADSRTESDLDGDELQLDAIRLLGEARDLDRVLPTLSGILARSVAEDSPQVTIAACLALHRLDSTTSRQPLLRLFHDESRGFDVRAEAALAIAQMATRGENDSVVLAFLRQLSREPSNRGMAARFLLDRAARNNGGAPDLLRRLDELEAENAALAERLARRAGTAASGVPADGGPIPELIDLIREHYVDPGAVDDRKLAIEAFEALSAQIDHVTFLSPDDLERMRANTLGRNLGLGAEFFKLNRGSPLIVVRSFHSRRGAAANRRLQAGDRVVSIDAVSTRGLGPDDIRRLLDKKQRGDRVELEVERWEWEEPRRVEVEYGVVEVPDLFHALLPRGIGYVRLERFRKDTASELAAAIALLESEHRGALEAFIFDLRNNGGGPLDQAVKVVDLFVDDAELPIVSEVGRGGRAVREYMPLPGANLACPLVVLINRWTASSAEVVAGSLQDFRRATIVGRRSYGKGVSQQRFDAPESVSKLVGGPAAIVLPNHYLHLPSGRRFHTPRDARGQPLAGHEGGIEPDVVVADREDEAEGWEREEFLRVQHSDELFRYVKARYAELRSRWKEGVRELRDPANYPDFARLYASLHTRLGEEQVLVALRRLLGRHLEEEVERDLATMISEDRQLRRALKVLGIGPESSPEYARWLPDEAADE